MKNRSLLSFVFFLSLHQVLLAQIRWPVTPQNQQASIAGTVGEYRESRNSSGAVVGYRFHRGVDITNGGNYNVYATNSGTAILTPGGFWDCNIQIGDVYYYHIVFSVENNQQIQVGDLIGTMRNDGPIHVHYQKNDTNFLNSYFLTPFNDNTEPTISSHSFYVEGLTRTVTTSQLNTIRTINGGSYNLIHNKVDLMINAKDTRLNSLGNIGTEGAVAPFQFSYQLFDSEAQTVNGEQICIRYDRVPLENAAASFVFGPGTTTTNLNWILTSSPFDVNPVTNGYGRYLNTRVRNGVTEDWSGNANLEARHSQEALYKDGTYTIQFRVRDVDDDDTFNSGTRSGAILIDNFRPYVKEVIVRQNNETGPIIYRGYWDWNGVQLKFFKNSFGTISPVQTVWIKAIASEGMNNLTINIPTVDGATYRTMDLVNGTKNTEFTMIYASATLANGTNQLNFQGSDFNSNALERMAAPIPQTPEVTVSIRQNATTWSPAPNPGIDQTHSFNGNINVCSGGSFANRNAANARSAGTCLYVGFDANIRQAKPGDAVLFTNSSAGGSGTMSYQWNFGSGASPATANTAGPHTITYLTTGLKTVSLTVTDSEGSETNTQTDFVSVSQPPSSGDFNASPTSGGATLTVNFTAPAASAWSWTFPGGNPATSTQQNPSVNYATAGTYDVTLTIDGVSNTKYSLITVASVPALTASIADCSNYYFTDCATSYKDRDPIYFVAEVSGGQPFYTYSWNFGDGNTSTQYDPVHLYLASGTYTVSLTATDLRGISVTTTKSITVISIVPSITATWSTSDTYVSAGEGPVTFTDASVSNVDLANAEYYWDFGEGAYPRYAYTKGPHQVCYNNLPASKSVFLRIHDPITNAVDDLSAINHIYVAASNVSQCHAYTQQWQTTRGARAGAAIEAALFPGQLEGIKNGDLSAISCTYSGYTNECAFNPTNRCFNDTWYASHGTPGLKNTNNNAFVLWAGAYLNPHTGVFQEASDGLFYQHTENFVSGKRYNFTFRANTGESGPIIDHLKISLTKGLSPYETCTGELVTAPSYVYSLHELGSFDYAIRSSAWNYYEVYFYAPNNNFDQIWIRPQVEPSLLNQSIENQRNNWITIDDFSLRIENGGFCAPNVLINNSTVLNSLIQAGLTMKTEGSVTIQSGVSTIFKAGQQLVLKPGFTAKLGSTFTASIGECVNGVGSRDENISPLGEFDNYEVNYLQKTSENLNYLIEPTEGNERQPESREGEVNVYPNPAERNFFVKGVWSEKKYLEVSVVNILGLVMGNFIIGQSTTLDVIVPLDNYSPGVYIVKIRRGDEIINKSIIVK